LTSQDSLDVHLT